MSIEVNPYTAFVTWPVVVASVLGRAKNARYAREWPSRMKSRRGWSSVGSEGGATALMLTAGPDAPDGTAPGSGPSRATAPSAR